jgi:hypothetical protein
MKTPLSVSLAVALSFLLSAVTHHAKADDVIRSAHDVKARLEELSQKYLLLYQGTEQEFPPELRGKIGTYLYDPSLYLNLYKELTTQKTSNGAIFEYFPGFPKNDPRHVLGPGWIYKEGFTDKKVEPWLKGQIFHDRSRDENNKIRELTRDEAKGECQKFGDKTSLLQHYTLAYLHLLGENNDFLDLHDEEGKKNLVWVKHSGIEVSNGVNHSVGYGNVSYAVRCVTKIEKPTEGSDQKDEHK